MKLPIEYAKENVINSQKWKKARGYVCLRKARKNTHAGCKTIICDLEVANIEERNIYSRKKEKDTIKKCRAKEYNAIALYWALHCCVNTDPAVHRSHLQYLKIH